MSGYIFRQRCRPRGDFRINEILRFLHIVHAAFKFPAVYDGKGKPVELTVQALERIVKREVHKIFPSIGATFDLFTIPPKKWDKNTVRIEIHTGTQPGEVFVDAYDIDLSERRKVPAFEYLKTSIGIFKPFEAFLAEDANETRLDAYNRQQIIHKFDKPAIIRGFHYLDEFMIRSIGGINYCLKASVWRVERFCEGVLIQLIPGLFDSENPEHLRIQQEAMKYFRLM